MYSVTLLYTLDIYIDPREGEAKCSRSVYSLQDVRGHALEAHFLSYQRFSIGFSISFDPTLPLFVVAIYTHFSHPPHERERESARVCTPFFRPLNPPNLSESISSITFDPFCARLYTPRTQTYTGTHTYTQLLFFLASMPLCTMARVISLSNTFRANSTAARVPAGYVSACFILFNLSLSLSLPLSVY